MGLKTTQEQIRSDEVREALRSLAIIIRDQQIMLESVSCQANMGRSLAFHINSVLLHMQTARLELLEMGF